jgi:phenylpyruvate tautomerase PptA (4-oxalocrotonate tautomerase family)
MVIPQGTDTPVPLGPAAVAFVKFCNDQMQGADTSAIEKEITERVTNDLMKKFKADPASVSASLDDVPASGSGAPEKWEPKTEEELRKMSDEDRDRYFAGEVL